MSSTNEARTLKSGPGGGVPIMTPLHRDSLDDPFASKSGSEGQTCSRPTKIFWRSLIMAVAYDVDVAVPVGMQPGDVLVAHRILGFPQLIEDRVEVDGVSQGDAVDDQTQCPRAGLPSGVIRLAQFSLAAAMEDMLGQALALFLQVAHPLDAPAGRVRRRRGPARAGS